MDTTSIPAGTIVVGVDGSESAEHALQWAIEQARAQRRDLTLLHAFSATDSLWLAQAGGNYAAMLASMEDDAHEVLKLARERVVTTAPGVRVHECPVRGDARLALIERSRDAAMIALGSRGRGPVRSLLLGSVGVAVIRHAECPVVIHRPQHPGVVRRGVLAGVDGTPHSRAALEFAFEQASRLRLPLTVLHCHWAAPMAPDHEPEHLLLAQSLAGLPERYPDVHVTREVERGAPAQRLVALGDRMDLVVVGAHVGGLGSEIVPGSVAAAVVEHARATVAVVPGVR